MLNTHADGKRLRLNGKAARHEHFISISCAVTHRKDAHSAFHVAESGFCHKLSVLAFKSIEAIINSMTPKERTNPEILNGSRRTRIAKGSGTNIQEVNRLLKQFEQTRKMMKMVTGSKMGKMMMPGMPKMKR